MKFKTLACLLLSLPLLLPAAEEPAPVKPAAADAAAPKPARQLSPELKLALEKLKLPGVKINTELWTVDVDSRVCLREGLLELIACTKDTKEHESIIVVDAKPSHIHTALLLLGARPGSPAAQRLIDKEQGRYVSIPPSGNPVDVFLVFKDDKGVEAQHPISDFITRSDHYNDPSAPSDPKEAENAKKFTTDPFLFAGSILLPAEKNGPREYVCDETGDVISISTFGNELLCMSGIHGHENGALAWQVEGDKLPPVDSKIILRLKPRMKDQPAPEPGTQSPAK
jgi:hypothetical protein